MQKLRKRKNIFKNIFQIKIKFKLENIKVKQKCYKTS